MQPKAHLLSKTIGCFRRIISLILTFIFLTIVILSANGCNTHEAQLVQTPALPPTNTPANSEPTEVKPIEADPSAPPRDPVPLTFADPMFESAVRRALNIHGRDITDIEAEAVTELDLSSQSPHLSFLMGYGDPTLTVASLIFTIEDVQLFPNLKSLNLSNNMIFDYSPLETLKSLRELILDSSAYNCSAPDYGNGLDAIGNLTNLEILSLNNMSLNDADCDFISKLVNLKKLNLGVNSITSCSFLVSLINLESLNLKENSELDVNFSKVLQQLPRLEALHIGGWGQALTEHISSIAAITSLTDLEIESAGAINLRKISENLNLKSLVILCENISNLQDLQSLTNIENLSLNAYNYRGEPLDSDVFESMTKLHTLTIRKEMISDKGLASLTALPELNLNWWLPGGEIDFTILADIKGLKSLVTNAENYSNFSAIENLLSLEIYNITAVQIDQLQNLTKLKELTLSLDGELADCSALSGMTKLTHLQIWAFDAKVRDITDLGQLNELEYLYIDTSSMPDLAALSNLSKLKHLEISSDRFTDLTPLSDISGLQYLEIYGNESSDINLKELSGLNNLEYLRISNPVLNVSALAGTGFFTFIFLTNDMECPLKEIVAITSLQGLSRNAHRVKDISALQSLTHLRILDLSDNEIVDITPLANLTEIEVLLFSGNKIEDLNALIGMDNLNYIDINGNPVASDENLHEILSKIMHH